MHAEAEQRIRALSLVAHPEGGWFRETFRSSERLPASALPPRFGGERSLSTSILYLLAAGEHSCFHRLRADELWWHHGGGAMHLHLLERGGVRRLVVGGATPQACVPHGTWFAAEPEPGAAFALVGCGVAPGFEYEDLELARRQALLAEHPAHHELVLRFTRTPEEPAWP
jgi:predicted cupin superfamily sugar epimerase